MVVARPVAFCSSHLCWPIAFCRSHLFLHCSLAPCVSALLKCTLRFSTAQMHRWGPAGVSSKQCYLHLQGGDKAVCIPFCVAARLACDQAADEFKPLLGFPPGPYLPRAHTAAGRRAANQYTFISFPMHVKCFGLDGG